MSAYGSGLIPIIIYSLYTGDSTPITPSLFLLMDSTDFLLMDGTNFLLMGT